MAKKALHHFNRGLVIGIEIVGVAGLCLFLAWAGLLWRLSQGPLNVDFLAGRLERALGEHRQGFTFKVGATMLSWGGRFEPFEIGLQDVRVRRTDGTPVLVIDRVGVRLSKRNLVFGRIVPKAIRVYGPVFRVIRWEDGHVTLNLGHPPGEVYGPPPPSLEEKTALSQAQLIQGFLQELKEGETFGIIQGLRQIAVIDAVFSYEDKVLGLKLRSAGADIALARQDDGLAANIGLALDMGRPQPALLRARARYDWQAQGTQVNIAFSGLVPARLARQSEALKSLAGMDLPMKGSIDVALDPDFRPGRTRFVLGADPGLFDAFGFYAAPIKVEALFLSGHGDAGTGTGEIDDIRVDLGGPGIKAACRVSAGEGEAKTVSVSAELLDMPMDALKTFWPDSLTPDPRAWVTGHLSKGVAAKATLETEFSYDPASEKKISVQKLGGAIDFTGIKVDYFPPLTPVLEARGRATYDRDAFHLDIAGGKLGDMAVTKSVIHISGLAQQDATHHANIDIAVSLDGPLKTALAVLDSEPLNYPGMLGLRPGETDGQAAVNVHFKFPLHKSLELHEVQVKADAGLRDVVLKDVAAGLPLSGGPMDLTLDSGALRVRGGGKLGNMPVSFDWTKNFAEDTPFSSRVTAKLTLDAPALLAFGVPKELNPGGAMPATATYTLGHDKRASLSLQADVTGTSFTIPLADAAKPAGVKGSLALELLLRDGKPQSIPALRLQTDQSALEGSIDFGADFSIQKARLSRVVLGETDVALEADHLGAAGYQLKITGRQLDASKLFGEDNAPNSEEAAAEKVTPLRVTLAVERLMTGANKSLDQAKIFLERNAWQRLNQLEVDGMAGGKPLYIRYMPQPVGHSLRFEAQNAGAALSVLGLAKSIRGGRLVIDGKTGPKGGARDLRGSAILTDFALKDAPVVAKLLNAMSLAGIHSLLTGEGIAFKKARVNFSWTDRGPPEPVKNVRLIKLSDGQTSGSSLGLTFEGDIDNWKNVYDLNGTIIPVSDINKLLAVIPLIGDVLTAGGEGVLAATYTVKGPKEQPTVMVNPLAVLAPGILRKLFFEK